MYILGISAFYHDSGAVLIKDEDILAAAQEERFSRKKHDERFPSNAILYCLNEAGITLADVSFVAFYDKPLLKFERLLETYLAEAPHGLSSFVMAIPIWLKEKLFLRTTLVRNLSEISGLPKDAISPKLMFAEHHQSHAASAFYPSPFEEAAILTVDGVGEWTTTSLAHGKGNHIEFLKEIHFPHSLGLLYSAFTYYVGFKVNSGEYKLMGLAPYGKPIYKKKIEDHLIDIKDDGSFRLNMEYFNYTTGLTMTNSKFADLFGLPARKRESSLTQAHMDIAASIQEVTEEIMNKIAIHAKKETGSKNLCLAGGVALNCVSNGKILKSNIFEKIWIQPASGDAGGALGAAQSVYYQELQKSRSVSKHTDKMKGTFLGPEASNPEIESFLKSIQAPYHVFDSEKLLLEDISSALSQGKVVGWHHGRMEYGPRSLGHRSIIGDARNPKMQSVMNLKIKYRESFRPFAPSILREKVSEWFDLEEDSPYMLLVAPIAQDKRRDISAEDQKLFGIEKLNSQRSVIPAVTHIDYSARIQTVHKDTNRRYHKLIELFEEKTGCPVIVNTSFNVRGEPIVCSPEDSYRCFMRTEMDILVIEDFVLYKAEQPKFSDMKDWRDEFELD